MCFNWSVRNNEILWLKSKILWQIKRYVKRINITLDNKLSILILVNCFMIDTNISRGGRGILDSIKDFIFNWVLFQVKSGQSTPQFRTKIFAQFFYNDKLNTFFLPSNRVIRTTLHFQFFWEIGTYYRFTNQWRIDLAKFKPKVEKWSELPCLTVDLKVIFLDYLTIRLTDCPHFQPKEIKSWKSPKSSNPFNTPNPKNPINSRNKMCEFKIHHKSIKKKSRNQWIMENVLVNTERLIYKLIRLCCWFS
jgi:hypothetical protein